MRLDQAVEQFLRRDRLAVIGALVLVTLLAWVYLMLLIDEMDMSLAGG